MDTTELKDVTIYTDGACVGNPGPGGYAAILLFGAHRKEVCAGYRLTTNNRMELRAAIAGLEALKFPCRVTIYTDSQLVVDAAMKGWMTKWRARGWRRGNKPLLNADLWQQLWKEFDQHEITFVWVKGHAGVEENERADQLAGAAAQQSDLLVDEAYENDATIAERPKAFSLFDFEADVPE